MNQWQTGQPDGIFSQPTPNHLNHSLYTNLANPNQFDINGAGVSPFQQQPHANGAQTPTSAYPNPSFQPGSVVPQKRPHDGGMSGSPPPPPTSQASRTQTPSYPVFPNQQPGQQFPTGATPTPYSHLQQQPGSNHATPSPTMQNQPFRQQPSRMSNASPTPFPPQHQQQQQQQQQPYTNQMSPAPPQNHGQPTPMTPQGQMAGMGQYGMNPNMMQGMPNAMPGQANNMNAMSNQQRQYQMRLMQHQATMRQQNGAAGLMPPRSLPAQANPQYAVAAQQQAGQMQPNGQASNMMQAQQVKRNQFLQQCAAYAAKHGRQFNPTPAIGGRPLDLYSLFTLVINAGGSGNVDRNAQWQLLASKLGFAYQQYPSGAEEIRRTFATSIAPYEKAWMTAKASHKQEQARQHAHHMAGYGPPAQASPTKSTPQPMDQQNSYPPFPQQGQQVQPPPHATPVQANASVVQNGMTTPQQMMGAPGSLQHRRNSSVRKMDAMTPQSATQGVTAPSPHAAQKLVQQSPSIKNEPAPAVLKHEEPQSTNYEPNKRHIELDGGYNTNTLFDLGSQITRCMPLIPAIEEMGIVDTRALTLSLASGIHSEVRYALDTLAAITTDPRVSFDLEKCDELVDVIIDRAEEQTDILADKADEVSDSIDLPSYEDVIRSTRTEAETLQEVPEYGTSAYDLDRAADKVIAITSILRNFSFFEHNHRLLTSASVIKWISNILRLVGTRNMLLRTYLNLQDFYKDVIIFLSNITQSLELPTRDDALHILHFLLTFAPQPAQDYTTSKGKLTFAPFVPTVHRYLPPAVDCLAKLLARQDPNRVLYKSILTPSNSAPVVASDDEPVDLLTRAFALSISVLPDRSSKGSLSNNTQLRIVEARKAYLTQGMLAADILTSLLPNSDSDVARAWIESEDGWAASLLSLASLLSVDQLSPRTPQIPRQLNVWDNESFRLITHRALGMMKRLAEKAGKGSARKLVKGAANRTNGELDGESDEDEDGPVDGARKWEGIPQGHAVIGAMMLGTIDKVSLNLLCGLHELAMQS